MSEIKQKIRDMIKEEIKKSPKESKYTGKRSYPDVRDAIQVIKSIKDINNQFSKIMTKAVRLKAWKYISYRPDEVTDVLDIIISELQEEYEIN